MANHRQSVGAKYGLSRDNFILDPLADTQCFARPDVPVEQIRDGLAIDLVTGLAPKRVVWGLYGAGKTHTLMRTMEELKTLTPIVSIRVECPDLNKKARFHDLYREGIMRALGQDFVIELLESAIQQVGLAKRDEMLGRIKTKLGNEEVAKAAIRLIDPNFDQLRLWRWISGVPLSRQDLDDLGQTQDLTQTEAARLSDIIAMLGRLLREVQDKTLVLVLDEMERLRSIGPETITTFVSGFTRLMDPNQKDVSIMVGQSAEGLGRDLGEVFGAGPVSSRLGTDSYVEIPAMEDADVDTFIYGVVQYLRDPEAAISELLAAAKEETTEELSEDIFPLTVDAREALKSQLTTLMTPREITLKMTRALGKAFRAKSPVLTSDHVTN